MEFGTKGHIHHTPWQNSKAATHRQSPDVPQFRRIEAVANDKTLDMAYPGGRTSIPTLIMYIREANLSMEVPSTGWQIEVSAIGRTGGWAAGVCV